MDRQLNNIATKIANLIDEYIAFGPEPKRTQSLTKVALWIMHAWHIEANPISPFLFIQSSQSGSGKSNLLELMSLLCPNSAVYVAPSPSSIYTSITKGVKEGQRPTLFLDEMDRIYGKNDYTDDMTNVLNANYKKGAKIPRTTFNNGIRSLEDLDCFSATVLAGIQRGNLYPDTVESRSIVIDLPKRKKSEKKKQFRLRNYEQACAALKSEIEAWAKSRLDLAGKIIPDEIPGIEDRPADNWETLQVEAILEDMGEVTTVTDVTAVTNKTKGIWESRCQEAAIEDSSLDHSTDTEDAIALMRDIVKIIQNDPSGKYDFVDRTEVPSSWLLDELKRLPEAPWDYMTETKRPLKS